MAGIKRLYTSVYSCALLLSPGLLQVEVGEKVSMHLAADLFWPTWKSEVGTNLCV